MSCCRDEEFQRQKRTNRIIEGQLKAEKETWREPLRLLLLGDEAKQAEFMSLVKAHPQKKMSKEQRVLRIPEIMCNIVDIIVNLSAVLKSHDIAIDIHENLDRLSRQLSKPTDGLSGALLELSQLCMDGTIQPHLKSAPENEIPSNAAYFLSPGKLQKIAEPQYVPSDEDIAHCKERPSSIVERKATIDRIPLVFCHFSKQLWRSSQKMCTHLGIGAKAVVYMIDCSGSDEVHHQDPTSMKLTTTLAEYEMVWRSGCFFNTSVIILIFGLRHLIDRERGLERYYPEYASYSPPDLPQQSDEYERAKHFIMEQVKHMSDPVFPRRYYYPHFVDVIDESSMTNVIQSCKDISAREYFAMEQMI